MKTIKRVVPIADRYQDNPLAFIEECARNPMVDQSLWHNITVVECRDRKWVVMDVEQPDDDNDVEDLDLDYDFSWVLQETEK